MRRALPGAAARAPRLDQTKPPASLWLPAAWPAAAPDSRHSRRVALLKRILPAIGFALLLLIALWPELAPLWNRMRLAFPAIDLREARELRMIAPRYAGIDRLGRPFVVTAKVGVQVPDRQDLMSLQGPRADIKSRHGDDVVITAATGVYQSQAQLLDLFGEVTLTHQNGTRLVTNSARIDVANNTAEGSEAVEGHGPSGDVTAAGFRILDRGDTIVFTGKSDLLVRETKPGTQKSAPPVLPAAVVTAAAHAAAEAKPVLTAAPGPRPRAARHAASHPAPAHAKPPAAKKR